MAKRKPAAEGSEKAKLKQGYVLSDGTTAPGVTTVLKQLAWSKEMLMNWAFHRGKKGFDYLYERDKAADVGKLAHKMVEYHLKKLPPPSTDEYSKVDIGKAENCFLAFLEWEKSTGLVMVESEIQIVSQQYRVGGTIDSIFEKDGRRYLVDFKSSNNIYDEHYIQIAAYSKLYEEHYGKAPDEHYILKLGKEEGDFEFKTVPPEKIVVGWEIFRHLTEVHFLQDKFKQKAVG